MTIAVQQVPVEWDNCVARIRIRIQVGKDYPQSEEMYSIVLKCWKFSFEDWRLVFVAWSPSRMPKDKFLIKKAFFSTLTFYKSLSSNSWIRIHIDLKCYMDPDMH